MQGRVTIILLVLAGFFSTGSLARGQQEETLQASLLDSRLVEYVASHPDATLADVASFANARLLEQGITYVFDDAMNHAAGDRLVLEASQRRLVAVVPDLDELGACGEHWLSLPAVHADAHSIEVVLKGERIVVERPAYLHLDTMTVYAPDQETVVTKVDVPWQTIPFGVSRDGRAVLLHYPLPDDALPWWSQIRKRHPRIELTYPLLLLAVDAGGARFDGDPDLYIDPYASDLVEQVTGFPGEENERLPPPPAVQIVRLRRGVRGAVYVTARCDRPRRKKRGPLGYWLHAVTTHETSRLAAPAPTGRRPDG